MVSILAGTAPKADPGKRGVFGYCRAIPLGVMSSDSNPYREAGAWLKILTNS